MKAGGSASVSVSDVKMMKMRMEKCASWRLFDVVTTTTRVEVLIGRSDGIVRIASGVVGI